MIIGRKCEIGERIEGFYNEYKFLRTDFPSPIVIDREDDEADCFENVDELLAWARNAAIQTYIEKYCDLLFEANLYKFIQNSLLKFWLMQTDGAILIDTRDKENKLGIALMRTREELKKMD